MRIERGTVTANTRQRRGDIVSIIISEPATVTTLDAICTRSVERVELIVSMSYDMRDIMSPVWFLSKYSTFIRMSFAKMSSLMLRTIPRERFIITTCKRYASMLDAA